MRPAALVLATLWALAAPAAAAADVIDDATAALRRNPVFQAPGAELALSDARLRSLREQIGRTGDPIFVAILPGSAGSAGAVVQEVARGTGLDGTYGVVTGRSFRAGSNVLPRGTAAAESAAAFRAHGSEGLYPVLSDFVDRTAGPGIQAPSCDGGGNGGGGAAWLLVPLLLGGGAFALVGYSRRRKRRAAEQAAFAETRATAGRHASSIRATDRRWRTSSTRRRQASPGRCPYAARAPCAWPTAWSPTCARSRCAGETSRTGRRPPAATTGAPSAASRPACSAGCWWARCSTTSPTRPRPAAAVTSAAVAGTSEAAAISAEAVATSAAEETSNGNAVD
jgi:hypothetical protein